MKHVFVVLRRYHSLISKHLLLFCRCLLHLLYGVVNRNVERQVCVVSALERAGVVGLVARALEFDVSMHAACWICGTGSIGFRM